MGGGGSKVKLDSDTTLIVPKNTDAKTKEKFIAMGKEKIAEVNYDK